MAQTTIGFLRTGVRTFYSERTDGQFLVNATEVDRAIWNALNFLNMDLKYLKSLATIDGAAYDAVTNPTGYLPAPWTTSPKRHPAPADFMIPDIDNGVIQAGLRRQGMQEYEYYKYQPRAINRNLFDQTVSGEDFFELSTVGLIFHYTVDFIFKSEVDASRSGRLLWYEPNLADDEECQVFYLATHPDPTAGTIYLPQDYEQACIFKAAEYLAPKFMNANRGAPDALYIARDAFKGEMDIIRRHNEDKVPDESFRAKSPRELGSYNSQNYDKRHRGGYRSVEE